ncbi:MAG: YibE/F family protein [Candidatus Melainabacteria bacterium]|nr:YibE/F family protein [Candidatus Melainabacteria bacterium]
MGKKYLVTKIESTDDGKEDYFIVDYYRQSFVFFLIGLFFIVVIAVAKFKGIRTIISLIITIAFIAFLLIPSIERGINPLLSAVIVSILATGITMLLVAGKNLKSLAATLGTGVGVAISGLIATFVIKMASLSGLANTEAMILWGNQLFNLNFKGLLAAGMIVSCLGAVMDVAISIASSIQEIKIANPSYSGKQLFTSGMNVGNDIIGTMTNTLVLAYTGMALPLLILISNESNPIKFLNLELVVSEVTAAIAGSIGLIIAVPVTAIIMSLMVGSKHKNG